MLDMQRFENEQALSIIYANASSWVWSARGYARDTDIFVYQGIVNGNDASDNQSIRLNRFLLCRNLKYFFYPQTRTVGRGQIITAVDEDKQIQHILACKTNISGGYIVALRNFIDDLACLVVCESCTSIVNQENS